MVEARTLLQGKIVIDYVTPDYYAARPKACMDGWGRRFLNVTPAARVLPCQAAETLTGLQSSSVQSASLGEIWYGEPAFLHYRGAPWTPEPCRSCDQREVDWGGCRCQAFALWGDADATDPACDKSLDHAAMAAAIAVTNGERLTYRRVGGSG